MSLAALALRICAVKALDHATSAGGLVYDSDVDPSDLAEDEAAPVVVVYTDAGKRDIDGFDLFRATQTVDLTVESQVARRVTVAAGDGATSVTYVCADTDAGREVYLGTLAWEIDRALTAATPWADLFREIVYRASSTSLSEWDRGAHAEKGRRFALRRVVYRIEPITEPVPGAPLTGTWARLVAAFEADAELAELGTYLRRLVTTPSAPDWLQARVALGLGTAAARALGLSPADPTATADTPPATEAVFEIDEAGEVVVTAGGA